MLLNANRSCLLVIDVQEKLIPAQHEAEILLKNCHWLMQAAQKLQIPILLSEQYPKGLGLTVNTLRELVNENNIMTKLHFSCTADTDCMCKIVATQREQIVVIGIEAHVCVLQTAIGLLQAGKQVFVVADAVTSRNLADKKLALKRLQALGVQIVSKEMVLFEWLHQSGTELFKQVSRELLH